MDGFSTCAIQRNLRVQGRFLKVVSTASSFPETPINATIHQTKENFLLVGL